MQHNFMFGYMYFSIYICFRLSDKCMSEGILHPPPTALGLPPNVVFQPKDSEPFAFEGLMPAMFRNPIDAKRIEGK